MHLLRRKDATLADGENATFAGRARARTGMPASGRREDASGRGRDTDASGGVRAAARIAARRSDEDARGGARDRGDRVGDGGDSFQR